MTKIILATTSPYRIEAFEFLGIPFEAEGSKVDESQIPRDNPEELVKQLSKLKAEAVAKKYRDAIVIGMDSVGYFNGKILEKPNSKEEVFQRLKFLSGKKYYFYTGVYMVNTANQKTISRVVRDEIFIRKLSDSEINKYFEQDKESIYRTFAHGYDVKNKISCSFVSKIVGSPNNVLRGIPLEVLPEMLSRVGYKL